MGENSLTASSVNPDIVIGVAMGVIIDDDETLVPGAASSTRFNRSLGIGLPALARWIRSGVLLSEGRDLSNSLTSSIRRIGVMPKIESGDTTLRRRVIAQTHLPSV